MAATEATNDNVLWARHALTADGWQDDVRVEIDNSGHITDVLAGQPPTAERVGLLLPGMCNLHSHAFQRAMAGMTETRGDDPHDSFWSWRKLMYRFLDSLTPSDVEAIAAFGQMEMLESGYTSVGEFHYLHHQPDGRPYDNRAEMCERLIAAAADSGIGLTLLPVVYEQGGCDGRALSGGQWRFGNTFDEFCQLFEQADSAIQALGSNANIGIAPHSLRAVSSQTLHEATALCAGRPMHIHVAEQQAEVEELLHHTGSRPVQWLLDNCDINASWCLIHATQMQSTETIAMAQSGAVAGLCPITESNLGDGIFDGANYQAHAGAWGIGTDSNVRIALSEELRTLEYSQRLRDQRRAIYASVERSTGRSLYEQAASGGATALQRNSGVIKRGCQADLIALDSSHAACIAVQYDSCLDAWLFAADDTLVSDVWVAGRRCVSVGQHYRREPIESRYRAVMTALQSRL